jgi:dTDP-4-dehydrorhamnose reductase
VGLRRIQQGQTWTAVSDQVVSPTYVPDLVQASLDLLIDGETGIWHVTNRAAVNWHEFACIAAEAAGLPNRLIVPVASESLGLPAKRPRYSALASERGELASELGDAIERYVAHAPWRVPEAPEEDVAAETVAVA